jgi:uncharacterized protein
VSPDESSSTSPRPPSRSVAQETLPARSEAASGGVPAQLPLPGEVAPDPDAVRPDPDASYERARQAPPVDARGRAVISAQIGRPARGDPAVVHRCGFGLPTVVRVDPRLEDGTPFPTTFWLACPVRRSRVGTLEADHAMVGLNERLESDEELARAYADAHERYVAFRDGLDEPLPGAPGAGGMPRHIKCLHVHAAHHLATGDNPVGAWTVEHATPAPCAGPCVTEADVERWSAT